jgi:NRAMP (natural resistance-associated macrophage protein)-like metal ion transporter
MGTVDGVRGRVRRRRVKLPRWLAAVVGFIAILGPGLISANAGNDAGGIITYASAGSQFGYRMLFLMVLITVALVVVQEMCARLGAYTGEGLGALIREQFPLRSGAAAMVLLFIANAGLSVSEFAGVGASMEIFGVSRYIAVPLALAGIWAVTVFGNYSQAERVFVVMGLVFLAYPIAAFLGHPHAGAVLSNLLWPHFLDSKAFLLLAVALIGTTITPYMQFYLTSAVVDKGVTPKTYKGERIDTINGAILSDVVSIFIIIIIIIIIIIATAAAIGGTGPLSDIRQAAAALRPVAGAAASQLFAIGLLGAALLAATVVPLSTAYAIAETAGVERSLSRKLREAPFFYGIYTVQLVAGAAVALLPGNAVSLVINAQVLNGFITPVLLTYILILANRRSVLGDAANGPVFRAVATLCVTVVGLLSAVVLVQTVAGWL